MHVGCKLSVFPAEIVEMLVASLSGGYLTEEETRLVINWGCDRSTIGKDRGHFLADCMREITCWSACFGTENSAPTEPDSDSGLRPDAKDPI